MYHLSEAEVCDTSQDAALCNMFLQVFLGVSQNIFSTQRDAATLRPLEEPHTLNTELFCMLNVMNTKYWHTPGIKEGSIQEAAIVVVAYKVSSNGLSCAGLGYHLIGHCDPIFGVVEVQEHDVKHQRGLSWDVAS